MEFGKTRWSCSWNSDQNYTKLCQGVMGAKGMDGYGGIEGCGSPVGGVGGDGGSV